MPNITIYLNDETYKKFKGSKRQDEIRKKAKTLIIRELKNGA